MYAMNSIACFRTLSIIWRLFAAKPRVDLARDISHFFERNRAKNR